MYFETQGMKEPSKESQMTCIYSSLQRVGSSTYTNAWKIDNSQTPCPDSVNFLEQFRKKSFYWESTRGFRIVTIDAFGKSIDYSITQFRDLLCFGGGRGLSTALYNVVSFCVNGSAWQKIPDCLVKNTFQVSLGQSRAFEVFLGLYFSANGKSFLVLDRCGAHLSHTFFGGFIVSKIELCTDKNDGYSGSMMLDFRCPLWFQPLTLPATEGSCRNTFALTLSNDALLTMEKQIRKTSVWGYERGRSLS